MAASQQCHFLTNFCCSIQWNNLHVILSFALITNVIKARKGKDLLNKLVHFIQSIQSTQDSSLQQILKYFVLFACFIIEAMRLPLGDYSTDLIQEVFAEDILQMLVHSHRISSLFSLNHVTQKQYFSGISLSSSTVTNTQEKFIVVFLIQEAPRGLNKLTYKQYWRVISSITGLHPPWTEMLQLLNTTQIFQGMK